MLAIDAGTQPESYTEISIPTEGGGGTTLPCNMEGICSPLDTARTFRPS